MRPTTSLSADSPSCSEQNAASLLCATELLQGVPRSPPLAVIEIPSPRAGGRGAVLHPCFGQDHLGRSARRLAASSTLRKCALPITSAFTEAGRNGDVVIAKAARIRGERCPTAMLSDDARSVVSVCTGPWSVANPVEAAK